MGHINLPNNWTPRPDQLKLWSYLEHGGRLAVEIAHRRWGKDDVALHRTACAAFERPGVYWHMLPEANQARKAIWTAINPHTGLRRIDEAFPRELRDGTNDNEMMIRFKSGSIWQVVGSDNFDSLVGSPPAGIVFSEWALADPRAWGYFRPIWRENKGWALFITTPRGHNHAEATLKMAQANPDYFWQVSRASDTPVFSAKDLEEELTELIKEYGKEFGQAIWEQEYNCSFSAAVLGCYYGYLMERLEKDGRMTDVQYDDSLPVYTFWDLGIGDHMAVWCAQFVGGEIRLIDYECGSGVGIEDYINLIKLKGYKKTINYGPHDLRVRELTRGKLSRLEVAQQMGFDFKIVPNLSVEDGRQAVRSILPRCVFDKTKCADGIAALQSYHAKWDAERKILATHEEHDWASHGADAFRYLSVTWKELTPEPEKRLDRKEMLFYGDKSGTIRSSISIREYVERKERERKANE